MIRDQLAAEIDGLIRNYEVLQTQLAAEVQRKSEIDEAIQSREGDISALEGRRLDLQSELEAALAAESYDDWDDPYDDDDDDH